MFRSNTGRTGMKRVLRISALTTSVVAVFAVSASAYTMDETGKGWVGKGEVQTVFGYNNATMQANVGAISFSYDSSVTYAQDCYKMVGGVKNPQRVEVTFTKSQTVSAVVGSDARKTGQWTGWFLTGFSSTTGDTTAPESICNPADGGDNSEDSNEFIADGPVEQSSSTGGLYAVHTNGTRHLLTVTPSL